MGKRSHDEAAGGEKHRHSDGKRRKQSAKDDKKDKPDSTVWTKNRIRSIERLLRKDQGMPQDARNAMERELVGLRDNLDEAAFQKTRAAMISKYHMVRFFERKKAMRLAKQLEKKLTECTDPSEKSKLEHDLHTARVDEAYAQHHPHCETYVALYPKTKDAEDDSDDESRQASAASALASERPPMWKEVEKTMELGPNALRKLRERRPVAVEGEESKNKNKNVKKQHKAHGKDSTKNKDGKEQKTGYDAFKSRPAAPVPQRALTGPDGKPLNRRERRKLMHKGQPVLRKEDGDDDDDDDEGGFFTSL